ncbi:cysteine desulfurase [Scopulibacillus darangshiensis]|uniref:Cysteine desulfurase n=1 Tax=Scopulibacillus darangshiensis TaxID=442528 RepID=A0A4R2PAF7_9BACL|nr:cysteine desulfurase family protein [Scopulibacillus darangshiensis]TCP32050.1 cysteine desulfurase [Scopulibacillus darangshiensis]
MIYLDNSATTKPYPEALETFNIVSNQFFANPSSIHGLGGLSEEMLKRSRTQAAELLGVKPSEITFTSGGTEGNNLAIKGVALSYSQRGKHIITTEIEHAATYNAFKQLENAGFEVTYLPVNHKGRVNLEDLKKACRKDTILISIIHVNNEVGTVQPLQEIGEWLKEQRATLFHVDHVQGIGKVPLNLKEYGIDLCTISGHKFHGPKGTGLLFVRGGVSLSPLFSGGSQELNRRAGTENLPGIAAMVKALRINLETSKRHLDDLKCLKNKMIRSFETNDDLIIHTPAEFSAPHIINVTIKGIKAEVLVHALEEDDIYVSTKSACSSREGGASRVLLAMGIPEDEAAHAIRISLSLENTSDEIDRFLDIFNKKINELKSVMG